MKISRMTKIRPKEHEGIPEVPKYFSSVPGTTNAKKNLPVFPIKRKFTEKLFCIGSNNSRAFL